MFSTISHAGLNKSVVMILFKHNGSKLLQSKFPGVTAVLASSSVCNPCKSGKSDKSGKSGGGGGSGGSKHQITFKPYVQPCYRDHDHKNMTMKRPMSPHLTIYAPTFPAFTSIVQRITGSILTFSALLISGGTLFLSNGVETYVSIIQSMDLSRPSIFIFKFILGIPFSLHYFFGIRYALWNSGRMLQIKQVYDTGKKAMVAGAMLTLLFALM